MAKKQFKFPISIPEFGLQDFLGVAFSAAVNDNDPNNERLVFTAEVDLPMEPIREALAEFAAAYKELTEPYKDMVDMIIPMVYGTAAQAGASGEAVAQFKQILPMLAQQKGINLEFKTPENFPTLSDDEIAEIITSFTEKFTEEDAAEAVNKLIAIVDDTVEKIGAVDLTNLDLGNKGKELAEISNKIEDALKGAFIDNGHSNVWDALIQAAQEAANDSIEGLTKQIQEKKGNFKSGGNGYNPFRP